MYLLIRNIYLFPAIAYWRLIPYMLAHVVYFSTVIFPSIDLHLFIWARVCYWNVWYYLSCLLSGHVMDNITLNCDIHDIWHISHDMTYWCNLIWTPVLISLYTAMKTLYPCINIELITKNKVTWMFSNGKPKWLDDVIIIIQYTEGQVHDINC